MKKLLWIGDAIVATGFARCTHKTLEAFMGDWEIHVLGLNYLGDPHSYPYDIYPCWPGKDLFGLGRTAELTRKIRPDVVIVQNDPWNVPEYVKRVGPTPVVATMPVDGKNCKGKELNGLALGIFWTEFGRLESQRNGYSGPSAVVPLGVDLDLYKPVDTPIAETRRMCGLPLFLKDAFIIGNVNRNQPRKRLDLSIQYFAEWIKSYKIDDAYLFLQVAPTNDMGYDTTQLMEYYGISNRLILVEPEVGIGLPEAKLVKTYSCFDLQISTTQGEGWGLTTMEGMACGVPQIVPDWSALGEWSRKAARMIPCNQVAVTPGYVNAIGGIPEKKEFITALHDFYTDSVLRKKYSNAGLQLVKQPQYRWPRIASQFREAVERAIFTTSSFSYQREAVG